MDQQNSNGNFAYNPDEWEDIAYNEIPDPDREGTGIRVRAYKKITDTTPRLGFSEYYTDNEGKKKFGKQIRVPMKNISDFATALNEVVGKAKQSMNG